MAKTEFDIMKDEELDAFFDAARSEVAEPSDALMAAIMADAEAHLPQAAMVVDTAPGARQGIWSTLVASIGGWPTLAGMATASVAGVWLGVMAPAQLETLSGGLLLSGDYSQTDETYALEDFAPGYLTASLLLEDEG